MAQITTIEITKDKLIELFTPIFENDGILSSKDKILDFMPVVQDDKFVSIKVVMVPKTTKAPRLKKTIKFTWKYVVPKKPKSARWEQEAFRTLYAACVKASNEMGYCGISKEYLEADAMTIAMLQALDQFKMDEEPSSGKIGTLDRFDVHRNLEALSNYIYIKGVNGDARIEIEYERRSYLWW